MRTQNVYVAGSISGLFCPIHVIRAFMLTSGVAAGFHLESLDNSPLNSALVIQ